MGSDLDVIRPMHSNRRLPDSPLLRNNIDQLGRAKKLIALQINFSIMPPEYHIASA